MQHDVAEIVGPDGCATWERLTRRISPTTVRAWVASGRLVRLDQGVYAVPELADDWRRRLGAVLRARRGVASHDTALAVWRLLPPSDGPFHVTVPPGRSGRGTDAVVLHRGAGADWHVRRVDGIPVTSVERSVVDAWAAAGSGGRPAVRGAAITAVRQRLCRPADVSTELALRPRLAGRAELADLVGLLAGGCRSELEIWGCLRVLRAPGMPSFVQQHPVVVQGERFLLDAAYPDVLLAVEMDGASYHGSREQRERDIRRDALVATLGWQTLRFSHARLTRSPADCRRDVLAVHSARARLMRPINVRQVPAPRP